MTKLREFFDAKKEKKFAVNPEYVMYIEQSGTHTLIVLTSKKSYLVDESVSDVIRIFNGEPINPDTMHRYGD